MVQVTTILTLTGFAGKRLGIKRQELGQNFNRAGEKIS